MSNGTIPVVARTLTGMAHRLRRQIALTFLIITIAACLVAVALSLSRAAERTTRD